MTGQPPRGDRPGPGNRRCGHPTADQRARSRVAPPAVDQYRAHRIDIVDELLQANQMTLVGLSARVGVTVATLSILKNSHAKPPGSAH